MYGTHTLAMIPKGKQHAMKFNSYFVCVFRYANSFLSFFFIYTFLFSFHIFFIYASIFTYTSIFLTAADGAAQLAEQLCDVTSEAGRLITQEVKEVSLFLYIKYSFLPFFLFFSIFGFGYSCLPNEV